MGLFDFLKKPKTDMEKYYEERKRQEGKSAEMSRPHFKIQVEDVFTVTGRGTVIVGKIESGIVRVGEVVSLQRVDGSSREVKVIGIEKFRKLLETAQAGENVGLLISNITKKDIGQGDVLYK